MAQGQTAVCSSSSFVNTTIPRAQQTELRK